MEYVLICCRLLIGAVFMASAVSKVRSRNAYTSFRIAAGELTPKMPLIPRALVPPAVVAGELTAALLLTVPTTVGVGFVIATALLAAFTAAITMAVRARRRVACNCFGASSTPVGPAQLIRNGVLLAASSTGAVLAFSTTSPALEPIGVLTATAAALLGTGLVLLTEDIAELFQPFA
jgi:hypothetical protein